MLKRIITAVCAIILVIPVFIFSHTWLFPIVIAAVSVISVYEIAKCFNMHKNFVMIAPLYIYALAFPFLQRILTNDYNLIGIAIVAIIFYVSYTFTWIIFSTGKPMYNDTCALCLTAFYVLFALNMVIHVRDFDKGEYIYFLIVAGACVTDIFAYFTGVLIGKHKLAPDISPKKTIEGSIGGIVFCVLGFLLVGFLIGQFGENCHPNYIYLAISGFIISIISQAGDLIMSAIKRQQGIKDFGNILPGHGGMVDRLDSIFAASLAVEGLIIFGSLTEITLF